MAAAPQPVDAQVHVGTGSESPSDALARNVKLLAKTPKDFNALIGAGKAALALGDAQSAAGFFGRAEEVWPSSAMPQAGMGAALAVEGDAAGALQFFARAAQLGATPLVIGADRGLAYDLLGNHAQAQSDYRAAIGGPDSDEARRRLALSLAISGKRPEALSALSPLMARGDAAAARNRAFVLALTGDPAGARSAIEAAMPGSSSRMDYFFRLLPSLRSDQKAAAVHLGIFPEGAQFAAATPVAQPPAPSTSSDRLASIDQMLRQGQPATVAPPLPTTAPPRLANVNPSVRQRSIPQRSDGLSANGSATRYTERRYWLQLASGSNAASLPEQYRRIQAKGREVLRDIDGHVAEEGSKARLLIGPFKDANDARIFADDLEFLRIDAFSWVNPPGLLIRKIDSE